MKLMYLVKIRYLIIFLDNNKTLAPRYDIGWPFFDTMVRDHIVQYNYTLNPEGIFGAIKYMYTYYPDPNNRSHIREEFINVSMRKMVFFNSWWKILKFDTLSDAIVCSKISLTFLVLVWLFLSCTPRCNSKDSCEK